MGLVQFDLAVIGGGINGVGIARDAAGRGLRVLLVEQGNLGAATSSASSKLIHGGLRYLEHGDLRLVREALREREVLQRIAPHLVWPLQFFLPLGVQRRPAWMIRAGLLLYDLLAGSRTLPRSSRVDLADVPEGDALKPQHRIGYAYWDCWGDDARLVIANELDARQRGVLSCLRTRCVRATPATGGWRLQLLACGERRPDVWARAVVNATGPWAGQFLDECTPIRSASRVRLVKGSHLVVDRSPGPRALILQHDDGRIVFVLPFEGRYTLIGTTDVAVSDLASPTISTEEADYLLAVVNRYFVRPVSHSEVLWSYAGVRPLFDDGSANPSAVTRDYKLQLDRAPGGAPMLSVFGGKLTTYRKLAEQVVDTVAPGLPVRRGAWTATVPLPGGDMGEGGFEGGLARALARHPELPREWVEGIVRRHGARADALLAGSRSASDLGEHFGAGLTAREVDVLLREEHALDAEDVLWRHTKAGLHLDHAQRQRVADYVEAQQTARDGQAAGAAPESAVVTARSV
jgi:glycerol-3-phosphate dehydrogenase